MESAKPTYCSRACFLQEHRQPADTQLWVKCTLSIEPFLSACAQLTPSAASENKLAGSSSSHQASTPATSSCVHMAHDTHGHTWHHMAAPGVQLVVGDDDCIFVGGPCSTEGDKSSIGLTCVVWYSCTEVVQHENEPVKK